MKKRTKIIYLLLFVLGFTILSCRDNDNENNHPFNPNDASVPKISFVTNVPVNEYIDFQMNISDDVEIDFGDGIKYKQSKSSATNGGVIISSKVRGKEIKIYAPKPTSITKLYASGNKITSADVRNAIELTHLSFPKNELTSLDISKNTKLVSIDYARNKIKQSASDTILNALLTRVDSDKAIVYVFNNYHNDELNEKPSQQAVDAAVAKKWVVHVLEK